MDNNEQIFKKCYHRCKTCIIKGNNITHNCYECNVDFPFSIDINNYKNCYENCSNYYYFDTEKNFHCTMNLSCPENYPMLSSGTNECIKEGKNINITKLIQNLLKFGNNITWDEEIKLYNRIIEVIENYFISSDFNTEKIDVGIDEVIKAKKNHSDINNIKKPKK